jgi:HAD superfamily hydrolase (TIGR01509 family)
MGWDLDAEIIRAEKKLIYDRLVESDLTLKPGARSLIEHLTSNGIRLCVASGSRIESIQTCLGKFELLSHFDELFSATRTARKKPYPDVFNLAVSEMALSRDSTVVIEDSPTGLTAALAANLRCIVCPDAFLGRRASDYAGASLLVSSLEQLNAAVLNGILRTTNG